MNWKQILAAMSGPIGAGVRYGVAIGATYAANKWNVDGETIKAVSAGIIAAASAGIGILTSSAPVKEQATAQLPNVDRVVRTDGTSIRG